MLHLGIMAKKHPVSHGAPRKRPHVETTVAMETKETLKEMAKARGISVGRLLDALVQDAAYESAEKRAELIARDLWGNAKKPRS